MARIPQPLCHARNVRLTREGWKIVYNGETLATGSYLACGPEHFIRGWNRENARRAEIDAMALAVFRTFWEDCKALARREGRKADRAAVWACAVDHLAGLGRITAPEAASLRYRKPTIARG
jgi:hypothetical protein